MVEVSQNVPSLAFKRPTKGDDFAHVARNARTGKRDNVYLHQALTNTRIWWMIRPVLLC